MHNCITCTIAKNYGNENKMHYCLVGWCKRSNVNKQALKRIGFISHQEVLNKITNLDQLNTVIKELEATEVSVIEISAAAEDVLGGFFLASLTSKPEWNLQLSKCSAEDFLYVWNIYFRFRFGLLHVIDVFG